MADSAHLEKMGRELKCPICLSLLSSAVSLTCNHVFCNLCLTKSMKSDSHCPVCKVPYRRREIRPAPHMDNLVSIYKTMEVASGVHIHVTQNAPSAKTSDRENQPEGTINIERSNTGEFCLKKSKKQRKFKKKGSKELLKTIEETSDLQLPVKPSFPAKKRVHVPQRLPSETPTRPTKYEQVGKKAEKGPWDGSNVLKEKPSFTARGEPVFSPFFWLREIEEGDKDEIERWGSQPIEIDRLTDTPTQHFSFSDIKDSDNQSPNKVMEKEKGDAQSKIADAFDSEMFEWTQRPCSPELCSTPVKSKVAHQNESDRVLENNELGSQYFTAPGDGPVSENTKQGNRSRVMESLSLKAKNSKPPTGSVKSNTSGKSKRKKDGGSVDEGPGVAEDLCQGGDHVTDDNVPNTGTKIQKKKKKANSDTKVMNQDIEEAPQLNEEKIQNQGAEYISTLTGLCRENFGSDETLKNGSCKTTKKTIKSLRDNCKSQNQKVNTSPVANALKEISVNEEAKNENSNNQKKCANKREERKRLRNSNDVAGVLADEVLKGSSKASLKKVKTTLHEKAPEDTAIHNLQPTNKVLTVAKDMSLRKCESIPAQVCCAFCQSSKDSKVSGEMMHYSNGRPVAMDYNGASSIIHAHRSCTEWAPNVYFEDEIAINLESELARSKRIKCSCCGIKGAALGCYEKSCRKSFHVPCAKLMPECRWDTESFVMLCPLHSSSKLPNELSGSQGKRLKQRTSKIETPAHQAEVVTHHCSWKGVSNKLVLCCSGLTEAEKEIVSEFTKMAGVSMLKTYGPSVTHVIASTDENGACRRTLKFLLGILDGKWILKIDWIKECMQAMEPVAEEGYEINVDIHGIVGGPQLGRLRILKKQPKLFHGCNFYFTGEFLSSYKGYLQDIVAAAGGTVLQRKPVSGLSTCYVIYNGEDRASDKKSLCNLRREEAEALASSSGAKVAAHWWVLDSIAACNLQIL